MRNAYKILVGKPEGKRPLGRPRRRWEDNIKMDLRKIGVRVLNGFICVTFDVLTAVKMSLLVFWVVTPCVLVGRCRCFGGTNCLHLQAGFSWLRIAFSGGIS
jgi:hypothetical protein